MREAAGTFTSASDNEKRKISKIKIFEFIKTLVILLLIVNAFFLGGQTGLFNDFISTLPFFGSVAGLVRGGAEINQADNMQLIEAARPLTIVITNVFGEHYGARYDTDARNAVYDRTSSIMGEALGSVSSWSEVSGDEWRAALSGHGVCYEYIVPVTLSNLNRWLDARLPEITDSARLRRICIAFGEDKSRLYYQDHITGLFYGADTASSAGKAQELDIYTPNGSAFAFETGLEGSKQVPYMLIMQWSGHPELRSGAAGNAEELLDSVLLELGHSNEQYTWNSDGDGSFRRVGTRFNISINSSGGVRYRRLDISAYDAETPHRRDCEIIEQARRIVAETLGKVCGAAEIFYETIDQLEDGSHSVYFGYYIAGGSIYLPDDRYAARIAITSGVVTDLEINFRSYSYTGGQTVLLPERQALAAAGGEFLLYYSDSGAEVLRPAWVLAG